MNEYKLYHYLLVEKRKPFFEVSKYIKELFTYFRWDTLHYQREDVLSVNVCVS